MNKDSILDQVHKNEILVLAYAYDDEKYLLLVKEQLLNLCKTYLPENKIKINEEDSLLEQVLALLVIARGLSLPEDLDSRGNFEANLQALQKHREEKEKELKLLAEAELSKKGFDPHKKVLEIMATLSKTKQDSETWTYAAILDPARAITYQNTTQATTDLSPFVESVATISPEIDYVINQTALFVPPFFATPLTTYKISNPTATVAEYQRFVQELTVFQEAKTGKPVAEIPTKDIKSISSIPLIYTPREIVENRVRLDLGKIGASKQQVQDILKITPLFTKIASFAPLPPNKSISEKPKNEIAVFQNLMDLTLSYYFPQRQAGASLAANFTWAQAAMYYYQSQSATQTYDQAYFQNNFGPTSKNPVLSFLFDQGSGYVKDQLTKQALVKFASSGLGQALGLGAKAAVTAGAEATTIAAGAEVGAAAGTAIAPGVGTIIGLVVGFLASKAKDIFSWAKRNFKKIAIALGAALGLLVAGPVGAVLGAAGGFVVSSPTLSFSKATNSIGNAITAGSSALVGLVATEIATPIIIIAISIPIVVALLLFIINTSALVVPPNMDVFYNSNSELSSFGGAFQDDGLVNKTGCPLLNPTISVPSYGPFSQSGHGGNRYWDAVTGDSQDICRYAIPNRSGCYGPTVGPTNNCLKLGKPACEFYGFALDLTGSSENISLPTIDGKDTTWTFNGTKYENGSGSSSVGWTFGYTDVSGKYNIFLTHVNVNLKTGSNLPSGTKLGGLFKQLVTYSNGTIHDNTHLHLEVQVDGKQYVRPENYFCNGK